jgi:hypothetical protein
MREIMLSKWWKTPSAKAAIKRATLARKKASYQRIAALKAKKQQLQKEVNEWKVVSV